MLTALAWSVMAFVGYNSTGTHIAGVNGHNTSTEDHFPKIPFKEFKNFCKIFTCVIPFNRLGCYVETLFPPLIKLHALGLLFTFFY